MVDCLIRERWVNHAYSLAGGQDAAESVKAALAEWWRAGGYIQGGGQEDPEVPTCQLCMELCTGTIELERRSDGVSEHTAVIYVWASIAPRAASMFLVLQTKAERLVNCMSLGLRSRSSRA